MQEESIVLAEQNLLHHVETFDDVEQVHNVQIPAELLNTSVQIKVVLGSLRLFQARAFSTCEASQVVRYGQTGVITELSLVED